LIGLTGQSVFVTTLVMPVILMAVGVSDDVYALSHFFEEAQHHAGQSTSQTIVNAFSGVARSIMLTAISTVIGLLSLALTSLEPLRVFGIFGAMAIVFSTLFTFTLVPALLALLDPKASKKQVSRKAREARGMLVIFNALRLVGPRRILALIILATGLASLLTMHLKIDDSWVRNLPGASDVSQGDQQINHHFAGTITLDLMVNSGQADGYLNPENIRALGSVEDAVAALPTVGAVRSIYSDILRVNASLKGMSYSDYRSAIQRRERELTRGEIEQAIMLMSSVRHTPISEQIDRQYQMARIIVFIRTANYERIRDVIATASAAALNISRASDAVTPFGDGWISYLTVRLLVEGQVWSIGFALLMDLALLSLLLRSLRTGLIAILPVAFSVLVVFAVLAATGTPLGIANSMFAGIAIGIGLDFSIHLTSGYRQGVHKGLAPGDSLKRAFIGTGPAIITSAVAITAGFSVLVMSEVAPNMQLGLMICLSLLVCAAATLVLVPSLVLARRSAQ
jgi:predicted RND superfamily exporter protein